MIIFTKQLYDLSNFFDSETYFNWSLMKKYRTYTFTSFKVSFEFFN